MSQSEQQRLTDFISKWGPGGLGYTLNERQGAQQHFVELCAVLEVPAPVGGEDYVFEKGTLALGQQRGFADVFKRGHFAWEYKAPGKPLDAALRQLMMYALALDNPPLLIVSDRLHIEIHTHFNGTPSERHRIALEELGDPAKRELLRRCFTAPESFKPARTNRQITEEAANAFATTAERLREAGIAPAVTSHLLTQCLFCFFAEDVGLLPDRLFERLVGNKSAEPEALRRGLQGLFTTMRDGGLFGADSIGWFNGGLFAHVDVPALSPMDVAALRNAAALDWSAIDPSIFGTLFERGLDPKKRSQLGAHYTDPATIMRLVEPVVQRPLRAEWAQVKVAIATHVGKSKRVGDAEYRRAEGAFVAYLEKLRSFRVLDPACGSGNFLYLALKALKDIEHQANIEAEALGLQRQVDAYTSPANVHGIEINEYAAELARVTVWIGELQWRLQHGYPFKTHPILDPLDQIECRDALMNADGSEAKWPPASVVIGNPPFVGDKKMRDELGATYTETLHATYAATTPGGVDLVCYWFDKALKAIRYAGLGAAGLVATQSIRNGANRAVLDAIAAHSRIFDAWADEPWINDGAAVRVSMVCFGSATGVARLRGVEVPRITPDLSGSGDIDLTTASPLRENVGVAFQGPVKVGSFDIAGSQARHWLSEPNPNGRSNAEVLRPWSNGQDIAKRPSDTWIVDFGALMTEAEASLFQAPFAHVKRVVKPMRDAGAREGRKRYWWLHGETVPGFRARVGPINRFIVTPRVAKHRYFVWLPVQVWPDSRLYAIAREDDFGFGVLSSRLHEI
jgi:methylase of polypeptide subunit release factors